MFYRFCVQVLAVILFLSLQKLDLLSYLIKSGTFLGTL